jgi:hypothetical protein
MVCSGHSVAELVGAFADIHEGLVSAVDFCAVRLEVAHELAVEFDGAEFVECFDPLPHDSCAAQ